MESQRMMNILKEIEMPEKMQERIIQNCYEEVGKMTNKRKYRGNKKSYFDKVIATAAALVFCICVTGVTTLASTGKLQGFFKDIKRWDGAVIGTSYEQATDEVDIKVLDTSDVLALEVSMKLPDKAPYSTFEQLGIGACRIVSTEGNVILEEVTSNLGEVYDGKVIIYLSLKELAGGSYKLIIREIIGTSKADQPLILSGDWACEFQK